MHNFFLGKITVAMGIRIESCVCFLEVVSGFKQLAEFCWKQPVSYRRYQTIHFCHMRSFSDVNPCRKI